MWSGRGFLCGLVLAVAEAPQSRDLRVNAGLGCLWVVNPLHTQCPIILMPLKGSFTGLRIAIAGAMTFTGFSGVEKFPFMAYCQMRYPFPGQR